MSVKIQESIEEIIQKHVARMKSIPGHSDYTFNKLDLVMYLASEEAKARSPPIVMPKTYKDMILGTVFGSSDVKKTGKTCCPNDDYTAFVEK